MTSNLLWQPRAIALLPLDESPAERTERRLQQARTLCRYAQNRASWLIADRLAQAWELGGCSALGCPSPVDDAPLVVRRVRS